MSFPVPQQLLETSGQHDLSVQRDLSGGPTALTPTFDPSLCARPAGRKRFFAARLGVDDWETSPEDEQFSAIGITASEELYRVEATSTANPDVYAEQRNVQALQTPPGTSTYVQLLPTSGFPPPSSQILPAAENNSEGCQRLAAEKNLLALPVLGIPAPAVVQTLPHCNAQEPSARRLPSLANRLAATLQTIQASGPSRKLLRSSDQPCNQSSGQAPFSNLQQVPMGTSVPSVLSDIHEPFQQAKSLGLSHSLYGTLPTQRAQMQFEGVQGASFPSLQGLPGKLTVPLSIGGFETEAIKAMLLRAAEAAERKDMAVYKALSQELKPHCRRRGTGMERTVFIVLQALKHRMEGTAGTIVKRRLHITVQEMEKIKAWYYKAMPVCAFTGVVSSRILLSVLRGFPNVHLVIFGDSFMPQLAHFISMLSRASSSTLLPQGTTSQGLISVRVTQVRAIGIARPGRTEFETLQASDALTTKAREMAESLGLQFSFHSIILKDHILNLLDEIQTWPGEVLGVCSISELKYFSDDLGRHGDSLFRFLHCIRRLQPAVVCMVEEDLDASGPEFLPRFVNIAELLLMAHEAHDSLVVSRDPKLLHGFEDYYWNLIAFNIIGCEGPERRWRIRSFAQLCSLLMTWGFTPIPVQSMVVGAVQDMLSRFPEGWGITCSGGRVNVTWNGCIVHTASAWCLH